MLPLVFDTLHELLEALLAADAFKERIIFIQIRIIDHTQVYGMLKPVQRIFLLIN